ncbi:hypothetical protein [Pseudarthrobacter sulfonivorans]|uniref:hypothetical protein n=1 Tax=Pseudarthrobacter sulfonivorans TaxID=121292 RepID=UPI0028575FE0|nr:hypothetical protein [Pseudarthrobacter sulfonivorans]MDR6415667.1 hypothetical protein [Pseudarthrobacter sulfonivorans]
MSDEGPWQRYDRDKLPKGWAYPIGRDKLGAALVAAGVELGSLSFGAGERRDTEPIYVMTIYWLSDARPKYFQSRDFQPAPLMMFVSAVPSSLRLPIGQALTDVWLEQAVAWAGQASKRGNAWTASDHHWYLKYEAKTGFTVEMI